MHSRTNLIEIASKVLQRAWLATLNNFPRMPIPSNEVVGAQSSDSLVLSLLARRLEPQSIFELTRLLLEAPRLWTGVVLAMLFLKLMLDVCLVIHVFSKLSWAFVGVVLALFRVHNLVVRLGLHGFLGDGQRVRTGASRICVVLSTRVGASPSVRHRALLLVHWCWIKHDTLSILFEALDRAEKAETADSCANDERGQHDCDQGHNHVQIAR